MSDQNAEKPTLAKQASAWLRAAADRIDRNDPADFGGVAFIVPPGIDGQPSPGVDILLLDASQDPAVFFSLVKTQCEMAINALAEQGNNVSLANVPMRWSPNR